MSGRKLVGGGRRGGRNGDGGMGDARRNGWRDNMRDGRRDDRRDRGSDRIVDGGNNTGGNGRRHGNVGNTSGGSSPMRGDGSGRTLYTSGSRGRNLRVSHASGSRGIGIRNLNGGGAGGKSASGGSGSSRVGGSGSNRDGGRGSSRVGGSRSNRDGGNGSSRVRGKGRHGNDSSEGSEYDDEDYDDEYNDEYDDDRSDEDLGGSNDRRVSGSEGEEDEGSTGEEYEGGDGDADVREDSEDEEVIVQHNRKGFSLGLFGHLPPQPHRIRMVGRVIDSPIGCRTLLALMRVHWPVGCIGVKDIDRRFPRWWRRIRKMFFKYYQFDPEHGTLDDAREAVIKHMRRNMRKNLCNERRRIKKIIKDNGGSFRDYQPPYFSDAQWKPFCDHWDSPVFEKRSKASKEAREQQEIPHTSGAISFQRRAWDIKEKTGKEPKRFDLFVQLHTKDKENKQFTSQAVREIAERYIAKCKEQNVDPFDAPLDTWVDVVGVRKNTIIGIPRTFASELIPLPPTSGKRRRRRNVDDDESGASTGRSVIEHMADHLVMQAVDRTVAFARAHPDQFDLAPEQVNMLAQSVVEGVSDLPSDHPLTMSTMRELVQVMVSVLGDVYASNRRPPPSNCNKGKMIAREEEHHSDGDDDRHQFAPPEQSRNGTLRIRGD